MTCNRYSRVSKVGQGEKAGGPIVCREKSTRRQDRAQQAWCTSVMAGVQDAYGVMG